MVPILKKCVPVLYYLISLVDPSLTCFSRRCLAHGLVNKNLISAPQPPSCAVNVTLQSIQFETVAVNTKQLRFSSRIITKMIWDDPDLAWNTSLYKFHSVVLPANKIWTPTLTIENAVETNTKPLSTDLVVTSNGSVSHYIVMQATVGCSINMFTYPFTQDSCAIALNGWTRQPCGLNVMFGNVTMVGTGRGEWRTLSVVLSGEEERDRKYLNVTVSVSPFSAFVTLVLPSMLIMVADLVSFAIPLGEGMRNSVKVTLVLSYVMSLVIVTDGLPDDGNCSPLIRYHFCYCLVCLVVSMLASMVASHVAEEGSIVSCKLPQFLSPCSIKSKDNQDQEKDINLDGAVNDSSMPAMYDKYAVQRVTIFLEDMEEERRDSKRKLRLASTIDKICFWSLLVLDIFYTICMSVIAGTDICKIDELDFWVSEVENYTDYYSYDYYNTFYY